MPASCSGFATVDKIPHCKHVSRKGRLNATSPGRASTAYSVLRPEYPRRTSGDCLRSVAKVVIMYNTRFCVTSNRLHFRLMKFRSLRKLRVRPRRIFVVFGQLDAHHVSDIVTLVFLCSICQIGLSAQKLFAVALYTYATQKGVPDGSKGYDGLRTDVTSYGALNVIAKFIAENRS